MVILKSAITVILLHYTKCIVSSDLTNRNLPFRNPDTRIVNGFQAEPGQFPHQALLKITTPYGEAACGGSLLSNEWVLTAAHCASSATKFKVILGAQTSNNPSETGRVIDTTTTKVVHPQYSAFTLTNDLSLIKLSKKVDFTDRIRPAILPKSKDSFEGQDVVASGWGLKFTNDVNLATGNYS